MGDARRHPVRGSSPQVGRHTEHNGRMKVRILPTPLNQIIMKYPRTYHLPYSQSKTDDDKTNRWYLEETIKKKEEQVNE